jgi:DNA-binding response OmpR family regulator
VNPPHRILVVEDEASIRRLITGTLVDSGYHVDAAENGADAWEALQVKQYDLLITDNNMPKVSGVQLLQKLHAARHALPVIMATAILPEEEFARNPCLEPAATLLKPYALADLLKTVKAVLHTMGGNREQIEPGQARPQSIVGNSSGHPLADPRLPGPNFIYET